MLIISNTLPSQSSKEKETLKTKCINVTLSNRWTPVEHTWCSLINKKKKRVRTILLTQKHGKWMPRLAVSPGHCRGSSGAFCSSRFSGRSARCRWAVSPASSAGRPAYSSGSPRLLHLLCPSPTAGCRLSWSRCSSSHDRLQHLLCHSAARSSSRDQCRPHRRCGCGASHHHRGLETRVWYQRCAHIKRLYASFTVTCVKTLGALLSFSFL